MGELIQTLDTDLDWVKQHTRLLVRAREWTDGGDRSRLLRGRDLRAAEEWLAHGDAHPQAWPTSAQRAFIAASRRSADRTAWLQRTVLSVGLVVAVVLASFAVIQRSQAIQQRDLAIYRLTLSEAVQSSDINTPLAAQLTLAAYRQRPSQDLAARLLGTENRPLSFPLTSGSNVYGVAFAPRGYTLASGAADGMIRLWDVADPAHPRALRPFRASGSAVHAVAFTPDGRTLVSGAADGMVRLWDVADPSHPRPLGSSPASHKGVETVTFTSDGHTLASGNSDGTVTLWDVADPAHPRPLGPPLASGQGYGVQGLAFTPDGHTMASGNYRGTIRLWNVADPAHPRPLGSPWPAAAPPTRWCSPSTGIRWPAATATARSGCGTSPTPAHPQPLGRTLASGHDIYAVGLGSDGNMLAAGNADGTVRLWNIADPAHVVPIDQPLASGSGGAVYAVAFSPDGHTLAGQRQRRHRPAPLEPPPACPDRRQRRL